MTAAQKSARAPRGDPQIKWFALFALLLILLIAASSIGVLLFFTATETQILSQQGSQVTSERRSDALNTQTSSEKSDRL